ncbi:MAG TPA: SurA N-terminal domain-containing protein [Anaerolineae bacterium]|nr:SurA N-terminal domain-containing protein [Anaerolineae bacterium]
MNILNLLSKIDQLSSLHYRPRQYGFLLITSLILLLAACGQDPTPTVTAPNNDTNPSPATNPQPNATTPTNTATPLPPSPTPTPPLAAMVNDTPIYLHRYERELARYEQGWIATGLADPDENYRQIVLDSLIDRLLIEQAARQAGYTTSPDMIATRYSQDSAQAGNIDNFNAWLAANQYTPEEYLDEIAHGILESQIIPQITDAVPYALPQVRARYIRLNDPLLAEEVRARAAAGDDFTFLVQQYSLDQNTADFGGDLGYFHNQGQLFAPEIETAAFSLPVNGISAVIPVTINGTQTYYILQVTDRQEDMPLTQEQRQPLVQRATQQWLAQQRQQATISLFIDPSNSE